MTELQASTLTAREGINSDSQHGAVMPPLHLSSNFSFAGFNQKREYDYTRSGNPTRDQLAQALAKLEKGRQAVITATGMGAVTLILQLLQPGERLLAPDDCYGGCNRLFRAKQAQGHLQLQLERFTDSAALIAQIQTLKPRMVWIETPSNPLLRLSDIQAIAEAAHGIGALVVADNTFLSPVQQNPLELGADIVLHSTTKYINGHSDVVGGAVITRDPALGEKLAWWGNCLGLTGAPFDAWLTLRGLRTLPLRMRQHQENALQIAHFLENHAAIEQVYYPGLASHPQHELALRQQTGFGGVISFDLQVDLDLPVFIESLELFTLAESLGGVESLIAHPATMTHASMSQADRQVAGIGPRLLRLSVGIEAAQDLIQDLNQAFEKAGRKLPEQQTKSLVHA
ncbi:O-succinylhomoserine (thiol)-lyase [bacterium (Candidatus Blackallbacteria) CG17_big_fil_post_rev_8_21_14_2_50_48_46]|uniref:L-methionine gamma-lyase n=1 Tax=bacterium (Candidatus Blackallbacteria) CG17_big_fil_post_rev_8_21_14_2_50_48_46 TaxID=2014261 RepID=A0A2M7G4X0_9BACT|nr:MAG: O-succinylhomoserine (thiol)-lyase [bacterium (Candidatus Blackallbacteria) CG18_big_fil_WC_8_21_14_2_50_49_26]PIW16584.1 MAG: O-succinylhomoserine (thiol)-lyase [bacterium (Candidatus Blackallbacteria) CG17_big_fil_post_rev_8_21_14_2_50_48_46]PIW46092.1 MAG: O-succinylhomoserine (thiol)-lyase [bacterium (Candidatus Blackallbacteria) CG13_big_fil_rev_8_21_14_2_50_49_14]